MGKKKSYIVFGAGKFGSKVAEELMEAGMNVMVVDYDEESVSDIADKVTKAVVADIMDPKSIEPLGISNFDGAVIAITGNLAACVLGVTQCKEAGIPLIVCKVADEIQAKVMKKLGADRVIIPEHESAARAARVLVMQEFLDVIKLSDTIEIAEIQTKMAWAGRNLKELGLPAKYHLNVIAVRHEGTLTAGWDPNEPLPEDSSLVVVAEKKNLEKLKGND